MSKHYRPETVGTIMTAHVPTCGPDNTQADMFDIVSSRQWASVHNTYVLDPEGKLLGLVHIDQLLLGKRTAKASELMRKPKVVLHPNDDQELAVFEAIQNDIIAVPVADEDGRFIGAVTAYHIIDVMHDEHVEDSLITAGVHGGLKHIIKETSRRSSFLVRGRAPWLIFGLAMGMVLAVISSLFEASLQKSVAIAYFIPVVAYIAGAVGTQSGAIAVRALAMTKVNNAVYILKEAFVGVALGAIVGVLGGIGAAVIGQSPVVGLVVGLSLMAAALVSSILAAVIPMAFKALGKDPAVGSGPLATALQDVISIVVYFLFASWLV